MADQYIKVGHQTGGGGGISGPGSSTDTALARWSGTAGTALLNSGVLLDASNNITGINNLTVTGRSAFAGGGLSSTFFSRIGTSASQSLITGTLQSALNVQITANSAATVGIEGVRVDLNTDNASFTAPYATNVNVTPIGKGASATISNAIGLLAYAQTVGGNNANFADTVTLGTGSWFIYSSGTNPSYFGHRIGLGITPAAGNMLRIAGTSLTSGTSQIGVSVEALASSGATATIGGVVSAVTSPDVAFTCANMWNFYSQNIAKGASSTVTRRYGILLDTPTGGSTSNVVIGNGTSTAGDWFIYTTNTATSYFAGPIRSGSNSAAVLTNEQLTVSKTYGSSGNESVNNGGIASQIFLTLDLPYTANSNTAIYGRLRRTITSSQTDTANLNAAVSAMNRFNIATSQTLTNVQSDSWNGVLVYAPVNDGSGTLALTNFFGINIQASSLATGTNKFGLYIGDQSGATNNWQLYSNGTAPSYLAGNLNVGVSSPSRTGRIESYQAVSTDTYATGIWAGAQNTFDGAVSNSAVAGYFRYGRTITSDRTDTATHSGLRVDCNFSIASGKTLTHAGTAAVGLYLSSFNSVSGTYALDSAYKILIATDSTNTGTNKYGLWIGDQTGATNNWSIYTGTAPSSFHGAICTQKNDVSSTASITALDSVHSFVKLTGSTATTLHGITAGKDGQRLTLFNNSGQVLTIKHQSGTAAAADQITTMTAADVVTVGNGCADFIYDVTDSKWINVSVNP